MRGAMYVETWVPKQIRYPYPIVFIQSGGGQSNIAMLQTPDGRPGWAYDFVNQGYTVYMMDYPGNGRSTYIPGVDGNITPPRSGPLMSEIWTQSTPPSPDKTEPGPDGHGPSWPQFKKYSAWPSDHPNKGKMGDPVFDYYAKTELQATGGNGQIAIDDMVELLDLIGQPVILLLHSGQASSGWNVADLRPKLVKGIVAAEPVSPPMENTERRAPGTYTPGRLWGVTNSAITYDPR
jgi:pimeloyl-ACP methyl ester carboxylesterase